MVNKTKDILTGIPKSGSLQWAIIGTTILTTLIANEDTLTLLIGELWTKGVILFSVMANGVIVALNRTTTTKSLDKL